MTGGLMLRSLTVIYKTFLRSKKNQYKKKFCKRLRQTAT